MLLFLSPTTSYIVNEIANPTMYVLKRLIRVQKIGKPEEYSYFLGFTDLPSRGVYRISHILSSGFLYRICATTREHSFLRILPP